MEPSFEHGFFICQHTISSMLCFPNPYYLLLSVIGNSAVVLLSGLVIFSSMSEKPSAPLRLWVSVFAVHSLIRLLLLPLMNHYYTRGRKHAAADDNEASQSFPDSNKSDVAGASFWKVHNGDAGEVLAMKMKRLEFMNAIMSAVWWIIGCYWIVSDWLINGLPFPQDPDVLTLWQESPHLFWLTVSFLGCNASFLTFWISAFIACLVLFGCLPNLAIAVRKAAPKYCQDNSSTTLANDIKQGGLFTTEPEDSSQVKSDEETGEGSNVAKVKKMRVGGEEE